MPMSAMPATTRTCSRDGKTMLHRARAGVYFSANAILEASASAFYRGVSPHIDFGQVRDMPSVYRGRVIRNVKFCCKSGPYRKPSTSIRSSRVRANSANTM